MRRDSFLRGRLNAVGDDGDGFGDSAFAQDFSHVFAEGKVSIGLIEQVLVDSIP